jgi:hypothetical protein
MCNPPQIKGDAEEKYLSLSKVAKHSLIALGATTIGSA